MACLVCNCSISSTARYPCKYFSLGCVASLLYKDKLSHEVSCEFRPYNCPCPGCYCDWQGSLENVMPHLLYGQPHVNMFYGSEYVVLVTHISLPIEMDWVVFQSCYGCNFMFILHKSSEFYGIQQYSGAVQCIGPPKQATNFLYRLELENQYGRLSWQSTTPSIRVSLPVVVFGSDCFMFDSFTAQSFAYNDILSVRVIISMDRAQVSRRG